MTETNATEADGGDESDLEYVGDQDSLSELNAAFGWRLVFIPFGYAMLALMYFSDYGLVDWGFWTLAALVGLLTIVGPAEYLYHRRRITTDDA